MQGFFANYFDDSFWDNEDSDMLITRIIIVTKCLASVCVLCSLKSRKATS